MFLRLGKQHTTLLALALLVTLLEPLVCVLHCTLWEPMPHHSHSAAHNHQAQPTSYNLVFAHTFSEQVAAFHNRSIRQVTTLTQLTQTCSEHQNHFPVFAQPFHEFAVIPLLLGGILLMLCHFLVLQAPMLTPRYATNLLRPPILYHP